MVSINIIDFFGLIPSIIFPMASIIQAIHILRLKSSKNVSWLTWCLVGIANWSLFIYTERYDDILTLLSLFGTGILNFLVVALIFIYRAKPK